MPGRRRLPAFPPGWPRSRQVMMPGRRCLPEFPPGWRRSRQVMMPGRRCLPEFPPGWRRSRRVMASHRSWLPFRPDRDPPCRAARLSADPSLHPHLNGRRSATATGAAGQWGLPMRHGVRPPGFPRSVRFPQENCPSARLQTGTPWGEADPANRPCCPRPQFPPASAASILRVRQVLVPIAAPSP